MVRAWCVFVVSNHQSRTWMSGSLESMRWNACVHRPYLGLHSHLKKVLGNGVRGHVNSKVKIPSTRAQRRVELVTLHHAGQPAQHTTDWAIPAPILILTFAAPTCSVTTSTTQPNMLTIKSSPWGAGIAHWLCAGLTVLLVEALWVRWSSWRVFIP